MSPVDTGPAHDALDALRHESGWCVSCVSDGGRLNALAEARLDTIEQTLSALEQEIDSGSPAKEWFARGLQALADEIDQT